MGKCCLSVNIALSCMGIIFGLSAFIAFFCIYHNPYAGTWAILSGIFAAICLNLHLLLYTNKLNNYHSRESIKQLCHFGFFVGVVSTGWFLWYIFSIFYWHTPLWPVESSTVITAIWAFFTMKWGFVLHCTSKQCEKALNNDSETAPLI